MNNPLIYLIKESIEKNKELFALSDFQGANFQYRDVARKVAKLHLGFKHAGLRPGDKIALCGRNGANWAIAFLSVLTYGAVAVPILHEFKPDNVHHLVNHSDAKLLFVDSTIWNNLSPESLPDIVGAVRLADFSLLFSRSQQLTKARANLNRLFGEQFPERFQVEDVQYADPKEDDLCLINYTSGSTGFSKGVMLSYKNLYSNILFAREHFPFLKKGDGHICMLPLAHMYGLCIEMLFPFTVGAHINFLTRTPSPRIIMEAFAAVHPKVIITVPLIIEKIIKTKVFPMLEKPWMRLLLKTPFINDRVLGKIKDRLIETFGSNMFSIVIGGAGLNADVEAFLRRIHFPFTVGYGMTECAPLIAYAQWDVQRPASCGKIVDRMEGEIDSPDPLNTPGVLRVRGDNVMMGYYKNPEATAAAIVDGWLITGDICQFDADGFLYIRGRDKNMILGPSGQNIYPEEIEQKINNLPYVSESLVVERDGRLVALVHPDYDAARQDNLADSDLHATLIKTVRELNASLPTYSQISDTKIMAEEFEKTPKRSIKRYLYQ
ncbi:MAG: AMP-binding protein [Muribaculaceae bacterium]